MAARRPRQIPFALGPHFRSRGTHGGETALGRRKLIRPIAPGRPMHLVLRSSRARGRLSLRASPARAAAIESLVRRTADRFGVRIRSFANVGNHMHLCVRTTSRRSMAARQAFQGFLRAITGHIARLVTGARKGQPFGKFWDHLAFSRLVAPGRDLAQLDRYIEANQIEGACGRMERAKFEDRRRAFAGRARDG